MIPQQTYYLGVNYVPEEPQPPKPLVAQTLEGILLSSAPPGVTPAFTKELPGLQEKISVFTLRTPNVAVQPSWIQMGVTRKGINLGLLYYPFPLELDAKLHVGLSMMATGQKVVQVVAPHFTVNERPAVFTLVVERDGSASFSTRPTAAILSDAELRMHDVLSRLRKHGIDAKIAFAESGEIRLEVHHENGDVCYYDPSKFQSILELLRAISFESTAVTYSANIAHFPMQFYAVSFERGDRLHFACFEGRSLSCTLDVPYPLRDIFPVGENCVRLRDLYRVGIVAYVQTLESAPNLSNLSLEEAFSKALQFRFPNSAENVAEVVESLARIPETAPLRLIIVQGHLEKKGSE